MPLDKTNLSLNRKLPHFVSYVCFAILGISGLLLNLLISNTYGQTGVGVLNQIFALYIVFSQLAAFGVHLSVQHAIPSMPDTKIYERSGQALSALLTAGIFSLFSSILLFSLSNFIAKQLDSEYLAQSIKLASCGLFFFGINKVLLSILNGYSKNIAFYILQALRVLIMTSTLIILAKFSFELSAIGLIFTTSELIVFIIAIALTKKIVFVKINTSHIFEYSKNHIVFGSKSLLSNIFTELNTRIDVLILGLYFTDARVGVYSFVATLAEGAYQLPIFQRALYNPRMSFLYAEKKYSELREYIYKNTILHYKIYFVLFLIGALIYPYTLPFLDKSNLYAETPLLFFIFISCMWIASGLTPFHMIFIQINKPWVYSQFMISIVVTNILLNLYFIQKWEVLGATIATSLSYIFTVPFFLYYYKKTIIQKSS